MATIYHQVWINASAEAVYQALATAEAISTWWGPHTSTRTDRGLILEHNPGPEHGPVRLRVVESAPNSKVEWECVSRHPPTSPASVWTGTRFQFEIDVRTPPKWLSPDGGTMTVLDFRQIGYDEQSEFCGFNNFAWGQVLQNLCKVVEGK